MGLEPSFSRNTPAWPFAGNGLLPLEPSDPALAIPPGAFQLSPRDMRDPGSIAGIDPALRSPREDAAAATTTRAASPARKWPITVSVSCLLHAAVGMALLAAPAAWYASPVDQAEIAGSEQAGLMVTGNADSDQMSAGDVTQITLVPMVDAKPIETVEAEPVQPDSAVQAVEHVTAEAPTAETVEPVTDAPPERTPTETAQPEQPPTETPAPEILTARADPADTGDAVVQPSPRAEPVEPVEETQQAQPQPAETVEPDAVATPQVVAVLPEPRPSLQKSPEKKAEPARQPKDTAKPPEKNQEKPRKKKANAGAGGANQADSKRGVANGSAEGKAAIASLHASGFRLGVATNDSTSGAEKTLASLGMAQMFDAAYGYDAVANPKPAADTVHAFCDLTRLKPAEIAMVGDNRHDLEMARAGACGLAIGVLSGTGTRQSLTRIADVVLDSIADLPAYLAERG